MPVGFSPSHRRPSRLFTAARAATLHHLRRATCIVFACLLFGSRIDVGIGVEHRRHQCHSNHLDQGVLVATSGFGFLASTGPIGVMATSGTCHTFDGHDDDDADDDDHYQCGGDDYGEDDEDDEDDEDEDDEEDDEFEGVNDLGVEDGQKYVGESLERKRVADGEAKVMDPLVVPASAFYKDGIRPPGTLLLCMLIKNEAEHLSRTLPNWAKRIDYWVIGVDDNNTDTSPEVIERELAGIPGKMVTVHFDGMGPTWTQVVEAGYEAFPEATHGILADADFSPVGEFDKMELDIRCSKILYKLYTEDMAQYRKLDWIYRNVAGAHVQRRMHQVLKVPVLPGQLGPDPDFFVCESETITATERRGGYQDRAGSPIEKTRRYLKWLQQDMEDYPGDTRTIYYLGMTNIELYRRLPDDMKSQQVLDDAFRYLAERASITDRDYYEEAWWCMLELAKAHKDFTGDIQQAKQWLLKAVRLDPERVNPMLMLAEIDLQINDMPSAIKWLERGAYLKVPDRALFLVAGMYLCTAPMRFAQIVTSLESPRHPLLTAELVNDALDRAKYAQAGCDEQGREDGMIVRAVTRRLERLSQKLARSPTAPSPAPSDTGVDHLESDDLHDESARPGSARARAALAADLKPFQVDSSYVESAPILAKIPVHVSSKRSPNVRRVAVRDLADMLSSPDAEEIVDGPLAPLIDQITSRPMDVIFRKHARQVKLLSEVPSHTCRQNRLVIQPFLEFLDTNGGSIGEALEAEGEVEFWMDLQERAEDVRSFCK